MAEGDHLPNPNSAPFPYGPALLRLGGSTIASLTGEVIDVVPAPFDCWVKRVFVSIQKNSSGDITAMNVKTTDATKNVVALATQSGDVNDWQTVHADVANRAYQINKGDLLKLDVTSASGGLGNVSVLLELEPVYTGNVGR